jgi:zinc transport system substrate-binding protein
MRTLNRTCSIVAIAALAGVMTLFSCSKADDQSGQEPAGVDADGKLVVYTVNYPLQYFAERIGGDAVAVTFPAPDDGDPAYWMPDPETIAAYQQAGVILLNGAGYAKWLAKATLPENRLVDTSAAFHDRLIMLEGAVTHSHGPEGEHAHAGHAFTTWLDPELAVEHARVIMETFAAGMPERKAEFEANFDKLKGDLLALHARLQALVVDAKDVPLVFSHPVYQYFERCYGLDGRSVHWEPDEAPDASMWVELGKMLEDHPAKWMIWEGPPAAEVVERLAGMGIESAVFAPCGNVPDSGDYLDAMGKNIDNLAAVFGK